MKRRPLTKDEREELVKVTFLAAHVKDPKFEYEDDDSIYIGVHEEAVKLFEKAAEKLGITLDSSDVRAGIHFYALWKEIE